MTRFKIDGWPALLFLDADGNEVDLIGGYAPPAEKYHQKILNTLRGVDTFKSLAEQYARGERSVDSITKLARKYKWKAGGRGRYLELLKEVVVLDPAGKGGMTEYDGRTMSCTQFAEFILAQEGSRAGGKPDPAPFQAFIQKYPQSPLLKEAYRELLRYYYSLPNREDSVKFYEEITARFPDDPDVLFYYVLWIIKDQKDLALGITMMEKIADLTRSPFLIKGDDDFYKQSRAELYLLQGDQAKAEEVFGQKQMKDKITNLGYNLVNFARFWTDRKTNLETAAAMLETALKLGPDEPYFLQSAADHYFARGLPEKAMAIYGPAYPARIDKDGGALRIYASYWAERKENLDSALAAARKSVELTPNAVAWNSLALVLFTMGKNEEALKAEEKAIELDGGQNPRYKTMRDRIKAALEKKSSREQ